MRAAEQDRPDVAGKRRLWRAWQRFMDPSRFVFLDETAAATTMARRYGRAPFGARLVAAVPHGHWRTTTFIAGLRQTGIIAPLVLDGPMTGTAFCAYVEQFLAPALAPGDVVVLDNLAAHKVTRRPPSNRSGRCHDPLPAAVFARPQPDRAVLRQAQGAAASGGRADQGRALANDRPPSRNLPARRVRQLSPPLWLWFHLT